MNKWREGNPPLPTQNIIKPPHVFKAIIYGEKLHYASNTNNEDDFLVKINNVLEQLSQLGQYGKFFLFECQKINGFYRIHINNFSGLTNGVCGCVWACLSIQTEDFNKRDPGVSQSEEVRK